MKNEHDEQLDRLFQTVRVLQPCTADVEVNFETRLLARLEERARSRGAWAFWTWRLVPVFTMMVLVLGVGTIAMDPARSGDLFAGLTANGYDDYVATSLIAGGGR